ncbi:PKD domain-containing protein, partial [Zhongshania borealis]
MIIRTLVVLCVVILSACSSDSSVSLGNSGVPGSPGSSELQSGRLIDSPVGAVQYETLTVSGLETDRNGQFNYRSDELVKFSIGGLSLGSATGAPVLTLIDLVSGARADYSAGMSLTALFEKYPEILNIARLLQSLDVDRDTASGIEIPVEARVIVEDYIGSIDLASLSLFSNSDSSGVKYVCAVREARGEIYCDESTIQSASTAAEEVSATELATEINELPSVFAGDDQQVRELTTVSLLGTAQDSDGIVNAVQWRESDQNGVARAGPLTIVNADQLSASFIAPDVSEDTIYYLTLRGTDNDGGIGSDVVKVLVKNDEGNTDFAPEAKAGDDQVVSAGDLVELDGSLSSDAEGNIAQYLWEQVGTNGELVIDGPQLSDENEVVAKFTAPNVSQNTVLLFRLTVTDSGDQQASDIVNITIQVSASNSSPVSNAGPDQVVEEGQSVSLDGSGSSDTDGDELTYLWQQESGPDIELRDSTSVRANFTAPSIDESTNVEFSLTVSDGDLRSKDTIKVTVNPEREGVNSCDISNPATYAACFAVCTDQDESTACPLPIEGTPGVPDELQSVLDQLNACADQDPTTVCPLPIESLPGGGDPGVCDATDPTTYGDCFAVCTD